jgi:hypothetical protein
MCVHMRGEIVGTLQFFQMKPTFLYPQEDLELQ